MSQIKSIIAAILLAGSATANAKLTVTDNGLGVYDSSLNATLTQDANLLGTLEANAIAKYGNDSSLITAIINASGGEIHDTPSVFDNGTYHLTTADFGSKGQVNWWAGQAFVHYLNTQNYAGSSLWALPSVGTNPQWAYNQSSSQLGELYYNELHALAYPVTNGIGSDWGIFHNGWAGFDSSGNAGPFANVQAYQYWSGTEYAAEVNPGLAWAFNTSIGFQYAPDKYYQYYVWAVSPGLATAVPEPDAVWLLSAGLLGLGLARRKAA